MCACYTSVMLHVECFFLFLCFGKTKLMFFIRAILFRIGSTCDNDTSFNTF